MELRLDGRNALVGGSTSGIGKAIAMEFAKAGANVILIARNAEKLEETKNELATSGDQNHHIIVADFTNPAVVKGETEKFLQEFNQPIHILVNNTGGPPAGPILDADPDDFLLAYRMHLVNNQNLTNLVIDGMKEAGFGRIINVISTSVRQPIDNLGVSNTTRGAVGNWAKTLANEIGQYGITVNNILPGPIRTPRLLQILEVRSSKTGKSLEELEADMVKSVPLNRIGKPEEIGQAAVFLASSAASFITGTNLVVDGGRTKCY